MTELRQEVVRMVAEEHRYHARAGETLTWFEFSGFDDPDDPSTYHSVYDTGPAGPGGLKWKAPVFVPCFWVIEKEDDRTPNADGRRTFQVISFSTNYRLLQEAGISQPWESTRHVKDMVYFDGRYYQLFHFENKGRLQDEIGVFCQGEETYLDEELAFDPGPALPTTVDYAFPPSFPQLP